MPVIFLFAIILAVVVGTFAILVPLAQRLGGGGGDRLRSGDQRDRLTGDVVRAMEELQDRLELLEKEQDRLKEQQAFMEALLEKKQQPALEPGEEGGDEPTD